MATGSSLNFSNNLQWPKQSSLCRMCRNSENKQYTIARGRVGNNTLCLYTACYPQTLYNYIHAILLKWSHFEGQAEPASWQRAHSTTVQINWMLGKGHQSNPLPLQKTLIQNMHVLWSRHRAFCRTVGEKVLNCSCCDVQPINPGCPRQVCELGPCAPAVCIFWCNGYLVLDWHVQMQGRNVKSVQLPFTLGQDIKTNVLAVRVLS